MRDPNPPCYRSMLLKRAASDRARSADLGAAGNVDGIGEGRHG